jgi:DNA-binding transcriptional MerR regulator
MPEIAAPVDIPNRAFFKAAEVCELVKVQPYVLRTWEAEFPDLGVVKTAGSPRMYRRGDIEQVLHIKHLLLVEGLTLAGARRRLEEESAPAVVDEPVQDDPLGPRTRERILAVKRGLQEIQALLNQRAQAASTPEFELAPLDTQEPSSAPKAGHTAAPKTTGSPRRKRSA